MLALLGPPFALSRLWQRRPALAGECCAPGPRPGRSLALHVLGPRGKLRVECGAHFAQEDACQQGVQSDRQCVPSRRVTASAMPLARAPQGGGGGGVDAPCGECPGMAMYGVAGLGVEDQRPAAGRGVATCHDGNQPALSARPTGRSLPPPPGLSSAKPGPQRRLQSAALGGLGACLPACLPPLPERLAKGCVGHHLHGCSFPSRSLRCADSSPSLCLPCSARKVCIFGSGSFGTAMATVLARNGFNVVILARREDVSHCTVCPG